MPFIQGKIILDKLSRFESICIQDPHTKGLVLSLYAQLIIKPNFDPPLYVAKWESDLGLSLEITE